MVKITACVITKNEEEKLPHCLNSVKPFVSEIIVVDTGSTDGTINIASSFGAKVFHFEWVNDFSKARNYAISKATGDWIVFLDADEYFTEDSIPKVAEYVQYAEQHGYDFVFSMMTNVDQTNKKPMNSIAQVRIFRNDPHIFYDGAVHEKVTRKNGRGKYLDATQYLSIIHTGYSEDLVIQKQKGERNLQLLLVELEQNPRSSDLCFYIAETLLVQERYEEALDYAYKALEYNNFTLLSVPQKNYMNIISAKIRLNRPEGEIISTVKEAMLAYPDFPDFYLFWGDYLNRHERYHDAIEAYSKGLALAELGARLQARTHFEAAKLYNVLGELYYKTDQLQMSVSCFAKALKIDPYYYLALNQLLYILNKHENDMTIIAFLSKIYDEKKIKNNLLLLSTSLEVGSYSLAEYYFERIPVNIKETLKEQWAHIHLLKGNYEEALKAYIQLFKEENKGNYLTRAVVAAILIPDPIGNIIQHIPDTARNIIYGIKHSGLDKPIDKMHLLETVDLFARIGKNEEIHKAIRMAEKVECLEEVADILVIREQFHLAQKVYSYILTQPREKFQKSYSSLIWKHSLCLYKIGEFKKALSDLLPLCESKPVPYRVYSLILNLCAELRELVLLKKIVKEALNEYPDSAFLQQLSQSMLA